MDAKQAIKKLTYKTDGALQLTPIERMQIADLIESLSRKAELGEAVLAQKGAIVTCGPLAFNKDICSQMPHYNSGKCPEYDICRLRAGGGQE